MIWGDQWLCHCGTYNLFVRKKCRDCREPALPNEVTVTVFEALAHARSSAVIEANYDARRNDCGGKPPHDA